MGGDSNGHTDSDGQQDTGRGDSSPTASSPMAGRLRGWRRGLFQPVWAGSKPGQERPGSGGRLLAIAIVGAMLIFPVAGVILGYVTAPRPANPGQAEAILSGNAADSPTLEAKPKPAAGKRFGPTSQTPPPSVTLPPPAPEIPAQPPAAMTQVPQRPLAPPPVVSNPAPGVAPPAPSVGGKEPYTPVVYSARHEKHFGESCSGQLTLNSNGLMFQCSDDPRGSVQVGVNDIEAADSNGIRLLSGKKYHFSIAGMEKSGEEQLFANWLAQVR